MFHQSPFRSADNNLGLSRFKLPTRQYSSFVPPVPHVSHVTHSKIPSGYSMWTIIQRRLGVLQSHDHLMMWNIHCTIKHDTSHSLRAAFS